MGLVGAMLGLEVPLIRSSTLDLDPTLRGENRVIAAAAAVGATDYVNAPGGRSLYDPRAFREAGLELSYLSPYTGQLFELLPALLSESSDALRRCPRLHRSRTCLDRERGSGDRVARRA